MKTSSRRIIRAVVVSCLCLAPRLSAGPAADVSRGIRVFNCDQPVRSAKRGVCANALSETDFRLLAPGVSWFYNWHYETKDNPPPGVDFEFVPMAWGDRPADLAGLEHYLSQTPRKPRVVLAINEPNLRGQAFLSPAQTAALYRKVKDIADRHGLPVVGPNMSLGSPEADSIRAVDPIGGKEVAYTFMLPFLKAFFHDVGSVEVPATAFHSYGTIGELRWAVETMHREFNRPVWVTEFAQWKSADAEDARKYLMQATDFLERTPYVAGYAWFKERVRDNQSISLLAADVGKLTPMGEAYVAMPVHDADVYYRVPGRLPGGNYAAMEQMEIQPTRDEGSPAFMGSESPGGWVEYHVQVDVPGPYLLRFRVGGAPGTLEVLRNGAVVARMPVGEQRGWQTVEAPLELDAGAQSLRVRCGQSNQAIHWIEFVRR